MTEQELQRRIQHARQMLRSGRRIEAERELRAVIAMDPENVLARIVLVQCLHEQKKNREAIEEGKALLGLAPDDVDAHVVYATALLVDDRNKEAQEIAEAATALEPDEASVWTLLCRVKLARGFYKEALEAVDRALEVDPEDEDALNLRAAVLVNLGRKDEAQARLGDAVRQNPESAMAHANLGWGALHRREHKAALEHFREALRLEPGNDWARAGLVEALKARYFPYRWLLGFMFWMARLDRRVQWGVIIGAWLLVRALRAASVTNPAIEPVITPVVVVMISLFLFTWLAGPIFNTAIRLNRYGRHALAGSQRRASDWLIIMLGLGGGLAVVGIAADAEIALLSAAIVAGLTIPVIHTIGRDGRHWKPLAAITGVMAFLGLATIGLFATGGVWELTGLLFLGMFLVFQIAANVYSIHR